MPHLVHGGPGRAGGGEEMGGARGVLHYMQRTAVQGSPSTLSAVFDQFITGGERRAAKKHPFRMFFDELAIGDTLVTDARKVTDEDVARFADLSGDHFYAHKDGLAAQSIFERKVAHGYFVLSAAAGLFVDPAPGPVLANYGLENLRFTKPVFPGDTIRAKLTVKQKTAKETPAAGSGPGAGIPQGVVAWDVEVVNQADEIVAAYTILTLVRRRD
jgi:oxepin-CoA hydrolase/3-oxo-5,6-dehydrosuberyl-CoA semialdehyde dehydrogenase